MKKVIGSSFQRCTSGGSDVLVVERVETLFFSLNNTHFIPIVGVGKRGEYQLVHGDLPRQHSFETIGTDPVGYGGFINGRRRGTREESRK